MKKLYKDGKACTVDDDQMSAMFATGWSLDVPTPEPESDEPAEVKAAAAPPEEVVEEETVEEETEAEEPVAETPKKAPRKIPARRSTKKK